MLLYITVPSLSQSGASVLASLPAETPVLLLQNAVYQYDELKSAFPNANIRVLFEDAVSRGVLSDNQAVWTLSDWSAHQSGPWIPLK